MKGFHRPGFGISAQEIVSVIAKKIANWTVGNSTAQTRPAVAAAAVGPPAGIG